MSETKGGCYKVVLFVAIIAIASGDADGMNGTLTGFCNEKTNTTAMVTFTNFVEVEYQSREGVTQFTRFGQNTCRPMNRRTVGALVAQCTTSGQPGNQQFNATVQCHLTVNWATDGARVLVTYLGNTTEVNISLESGPCPSVANVSAVPSGLNHNVTVEAVKPDCSGWEQIVSYKFTIVCEANCTSDYRDSANSSVPMWVFPGVSAGVLTVTVTAENSCGEQTVLVQKNISVGLKEEDKRDSSAGCDTTCIIAIIMVLVTIGALVCAGVGIYVMSRKMRRRA